MAMKRKYILTMAAALLLLTACGPKLHRYSCGGKRRCISHKEHIQKQEPLKKQELPKRNA